MINVEKPFSLYCNASIEYIGRAKSTCSAGNYLIIRKGDGSLQIHGNTLYKPLNYQPPGAIMHKDGSKLISTRKNEVITITINYIINYLELDGWTTNKINLTGNEYDYRAEWVKSATNVKELYLEYRTPLGLLDLLILDNLDNYHIYEFKRRKANLNGGGQLLRYVEYLKSASNKTCHGYLVAPDITANTLKFLTNHNLQFVKFEFNI